MSTEETYGWFPGGSYDPRQFEPDREVNTPKEIAAWERLCAAWNAGAASVVFASGMCADGVIRCGSPLGMGTYTVEVGDEPDPGAEDDVPALVCEVA